MKKHIIVLGTVLPLLGGCSFFNSTPAQQQATLATDEAKVIYFLQAAGCVAKDAAGTAQQLGISAVLDNRGNAVLTKVGSTAATACSLTVPATAVAATPAS